ncbi:DEAD/DEAH box helicase [Marinoscillum sp. MHG1-6]|uniref:DEAD/DEAH box helicase n=1 Tax=Marinoscillum sp. MHG1-6 TaxID=2959627 RepID=UPI002157F0CC|nr:DEAD/DEAH box helicase [Marinoscillum sp. MHG1-6]
MATFDDLKLSKPLTNAIEDLGFTSPTPIQEQAFPVILSGKDVVGIAQTGTGKTFAYLLPIIKELKFSNQVNPRVLILVPTRELVLQVVEETEKLFAYMNHRVMGVYGGGNINTQKIAVAEGMDILVATPGRLYDLVLAKAIMLRDVKKLVIDEVDVMLDLGFRFQLTNIIELLPHKRQNIMFSATMTEDVDAMIDDFFVAPERISIAVSGTPLENIEQTSYPVKNFYTKVNLLIHLLRDKKTFEKVLVFVSSKKNADKLFEELEPFFSSESCIIHSNKSQNYRERSITQFEDGRNRILVATDVIARGMDLTKVSHVVNMDVPNYPENYMHRIGRTGRAEELGHSILFYTEKEESLKLDIEVLMNQEIRVQEFPQEVEIDSRLLPEERPKKKDKELSSGKNLKKDAEAGEAFHEKKLKNTKVNLGGSYKRKVKKHKKPKTRGNKKQNRRR